MDKKEILNIYVDIDSLFDTRLALLYYLDHQVAERLATSGDYYCRIIDSFEYIDSSLFKTLYRDRNKTLLNLAAPTNILTLVKDYYVELSTNASMVGNNEPIKLYLNIHRYDLNISEQTILEDSLCAYIPGLSVKIIDLPDIDITPTWINANISVMFMYNGMGWLELHTSTLELISRPLPDVILLAPALVTGEKSGRKHIPDVDQFFDQIEEVTTLLIAVKLLPVIDFSRI